MITQTNERRLECSPQELTASVMREFLSGVNPDNVIDINLSYGQRDELERVSLRIDFVPTVAGVVSDQRRDN